MADLTEFRDILMEKTGFANIAFTRPSGKPHVSPMWFNMSDEDFKNGIITVNTATGRVKANHLVVGAAVALSLLDPENGYRYLGIDGEVIEAAVGDVAEKHIDLLAKKYLNKDSYPYRKESESRIKISIKINSIHPSMG